MKTGVLVNINFSFKFFYCNLIIKQKHHSSSFSITKGINEFYKYLQIIFIGNTKDTVFLGILKEWWAVQDSNLRPPACKADALTS